MMAQQNQALLAALMRMQYHHQQALAALAPANCHMINFPTWDGTKATKQDFLFRVNMMKQDTFFAPGTTWTHFVPGFKAQNNSLLASIVDKIPQKDHAIFTDNSTITTVGFAMLHWLIYTLKGDTIENRILAISDLASFEFKATDTTSSYIACMRGLQTALLGCTIDQFLSLISLAKLDPGLYPGLTNYFSKAIPSFLLRT